MAGPKTSPALADIAVCYGKRQAGAEGVMSALQKARWTYDKRPMQPAGTLDLPRRFSDAAPRSLVDPYNNEPSDESAPSSPDVHEGFENLSTPPQSIPLPPSREESGLPPTPPTLSGSDVADSKREIEASSAPLFADGARNALKSGQSTTPVNQQLSPPTPDASPPQTVKFEEPPPSNQSPDVKEKSQFLHPFDAGGASEHLLRQYPSSRADSFKTAREERAFSPDYATPEVVLAEDDTLPEHWLSSTRALTTTDDGDLVVNETPTMVGPMTPPQAYTPRRRSKHESPPQTARDDTDLEKHISYVSGPEDLTDDALRDNDLAIDNQLRELQDKERTDKEEPRGLGLSVADANGSPGSAEDLNNIVYKRIREENVKRLSTISANSGAIPVGIVVPADVARQRTLKRQSRCASLRGDTPESKRGSGSSAEHERKLKHQKVRLPTRDASTSSKLEDSPVLDSNIRQVSSPARLGPDASNMTALTYASMQDSPSAKRVSKFKPTPTPRALTYDEAAVAPSKPESAHKLRHSINDDNLSKSITAFPKPELSQKLRHLSNDDSLSKNTTTSPVPETSHKLRHFSNDDSLAKNMSVKRTVQEASPPQHSGSFKIYREPEPAPGHKLRHVTYGDRLSKNMSVRRTSLEASPPQHNGSFRIYREPEPALRQSSAPVNNMAVKRSSVDAAKAEQTRNISMPTRGVAQSIGSESEEVSPSSKLRRFSREERLENNENLRRTSLGHTTPQSSPPQVMPADAVTARRSIDKVASPASPRKSLDTLFLRPTTTPMSTSQFSDRTDNVELCEARGIEIYPHNNNSVLMVQHGSRPASKDADSPTSTLQTQLGKLLFEAHIDPPTPTLASSRPAHQVDSPLTNPRAAPEPPVIKFIPPTPNSELEKKLDGYDEPANASVPRAQPNLPEKRMSLTQRARRYSETLFPRIGSYRQPSDYDQDERDAYLSPAWRPQRDDDALYSDEEFEQFESLEPLPPGGDTSNIDEIERKRGLIPRAMSKRMPGFRGTGGFLIGNSLGLDRHGTNRRRHYVSTGSRTLSQRQSQELLKNLSSKRSTSSQGSQDSLRKAAQARRSFSVPFSGGMKARWVGVQGFRNRMQAMRIAKEEKEREKRRERLRQSIGYRVYHPRP